MCSAVAKAPQNAHSQEIIALVGRHRPQILTLLCEIHACPLGSYMEWGKGMEQNEGGKMNLAFSHIAHKEMELVGNLGAKICPSSVVGR